MKKYIPTLLLIILTGCFISCEKEIEFKGTITNPLLVLNGILSPDSVVSIHLSESRFYLGDVKPFKHISDATVSMFVNGNLKEKLNHVVNGTYRGTYFPKPGDQIKIEVTAKGFDLVRSQTVIPQNTNLVVNDSTVNMEEREYVNPNQPNTVYFSKERSMQLQLKLTDAVNEENYYFIKAKQNFYQKDKLIHERALEVILSEVLKNNITDSGNILEDIIGDEGYTNRTDNLFTDHFVNGKEILFDFSFYDLVESSRYVNGEKVDEGNDKEGIVEYIIEIAEFSKDMYQYVVSGNKSANTEDAGFSEPVQVHSNIDNGIGILGSYNTYRFVSRFQTKSLPYYRPQPGVGGGL